MSSFFRVHLCCRAPARRSFWGRATWKNTAAKAFSDKQGEGKVSGPGWFFPSTNFTNPGLTKESFREDEKLSHYKAKAKDTNTSSTSRPSGGQASTCLQVTMTPSPACLPCARAAEAFNHPV